MIFFATENTETTSSKTANKTKTSGKVLSIMGIIACVLLAPILILNIVLIVQGFSSDKGSIPNIGGNFPLMVQSGSMSGTIEVGDLIIAHTVDDTQNFKKDDIITFWDDEPGGILVTHRIIEVTTDGDGKLAYRTKGDANNASDARLVYPENIVGIYQFRIPWLGNVALFMQTIPGLIVCVFVPLVLFVIYDILRRRHIEKGEKEETAALLAELERLKSENAAMAAQSDSKASEVSEQNK